MTPFFESGHFVVGDGDAYDVIYIGQFERNSSATNTAATVSGIL